MFIRIIDIFFSIIGLILLLLILPVIAILIKLDSKGPVFYRCDRVGLNGKLFKMYKFRTMYETGSDLGPSVSPWGDPRVTQVGRVLRRLKLNEFPQFINVLKGEMTLIGPRPEAPDLAAAYPEAAKKIFTVKPGLAGPNQILGRNEEEFFPQGADPVRYYIEHLLPRKLPLDLQYIEDQSIFKNLKYLLLSVKVTLAGAISRRHIWDNRSQILLLLCDLALCLFSFTLAHFIRYEGFSNPIAYRSFTRILPWVVIIRAPIFIYYGFYHTIIRHLSIHDIKAVFKGVTVASLTLAGLSFLSGLTLGPPQAAYARGVFFLDWANLTILLIAYRLLIKKVRLGVLGENNNKTKVFIWGAGDAGELCASYLRKQQNNNFEVVGYIDDDPRKRGKRLNGIKVLGNRHHLEILSKLYKIKAVFVAIHSIPDEEANHILEVCQNQRLETYFFNLEITGHGEFITRKQESVGTVGYHFPARLGTPALKGLKR